MTFRIGAHSFALLLFCSLFSRAFGQAVTPGSGDPRTYKYYPGTVLGLGLGFNPNDITDPKKPCIVVNERQLDPGPPSTRVAAYYIKKAEDFAFAANLDAKAEASYLGAGGSAHMNVDTTSTFSQNSVNVVLNAVSDFGRWGLKAPVELTADAQKLLSTPRKFATICGTRYVAMEQRASAVGVLISVSSVREDFKSSFEGDMQGHGDIGVVSASASAKFSAELKRGFKQNRVRVQVFATGGAGLGSLGGVLNGLAGQEDPMQALTTGLSGFLEKFSKDNAAIYSFTVASMEQFGWDSASLDPWTDLKESQLREIAAKYNDVTDEIKNLQDYLAHGMWFEAQNKALEPTVKDVLPRLKQFQLALAEAHKRCKEDLHSATCVMPVADSAEMPDFLPPKPPRQYFEVLPHPSTGPPIAGVYTSPPDYWTRFARIKGDRARSILSAPDDRQLHLVQVIYDQAESFTGQLMMEGSFLDTEQIVFVEDDGTEKSVTFLSKADYSGGGHTWSVIPRFPKKDNDLYVKTTFDGMISNWMAGFDGEHRGTFSRDVKDRLGRKFRLPLMDAHWVSSGGNLSTLEEQFEYE